MRHLIFLLLASLAQAQVYYSDSASVSTGRQFYNALAQSDARNIFIVEDISFEGWPVEGVEVTREVVVQRQYVIPSIFTVNVWNLSRGAVRCYTDQCKFVIKGPGFVFTNNSFSSRFEFSNHIPSFLSVVSGSVQS